MIYPMLPFPVTLSDPQVRFQVHWVIIEYRCPWHIVSICVCSWRAICLR